MALRKLASHALPSPTEADTKSRTAIDRAIAASPIAPALAFWDSLRELEPWWPVLIPMLLWVFWRTYRRERAALGPEDSRP